MLNVRFLGQIDYRTIEHPWIINEIITEKNIYNIALFILDLVKKVESSPAHPAKMTPNKTPFSPKATFEAPTPRLDSEVLSTGPKPVIMTPASQSMSDPDKSDYDEMNDMKGGFCLAFSIDFCQFLMFFTSSNFFFGIFKGIFGNF